MKNLFIALFKPWRLSPTLVGGRPFRLFEIHIASGLLIVPTILMTLWFVQRLERTAGEPEPQARLIARMADGITQAAPAPPAVMAAKIAAAAVGWSVGGIAGGLLGVALLGSLLTGLRGKRTQVKGPSGWRLASSASVYLPLAVIPGAMGMDIYAKIKTGYAGPVAMEIFLAVALSVWFAAGLGAAAWGWLRTALGKSRLRAACEACLCVPIGALTSWLAVSVAWTLTWLPVQLIDRLVA
jgi:hypothetical protein